ncbi:hypothetical protein CW304_27815 [Bacillus sp. UFRGS-B20]|nr:hypothetical protein CW304_27815 [Bacillus sp. UFRGS-B20]
MNTGSGYVTTQLSESRYTNSSRQQRWRTPYTSIKPCLRFNWPIYDFLVDHSHFGGRKNTRFSVRSCKKIRNRCLQLYIIMRKIREQIKARNTIQQQFENIVEVRAFTLQRISRVSKLASVQC